MYIRINDLVVMLAGDNKGARGKVVRVLRDKNQVVVEGVNKVYKHLKPSRANPQGGRLSKEMPVDVSNVALVDPSTGRAGRVAVRYTADGTKELFFKKSQRTIRALGKPNPKYAKAQ